METNGCGGKGAKIKAPNFIFKASCNKHDRLYNKGGKAIDRYVADLVFYWYMLGDCHRAAKEFWPVYPIVWIFCFTWASIYMLAVRIFGKKYFTYK